MNHTKNDKAINFPSNKEIEDCISSAFIRKVDIEDLRLKAFKESTMHFWRRYRFKTFFFRKIISPLKSVSRVKKEYAQVWLTEQYPGSADINHKYFLAWGNKTIEVIGWAEKRVHLMILSKVISQTKVKTYLEVGSGNGAMLMMLSTMHPNVKFVGVELTEEGVSAAKRMQLNDSLPIEMIKFVPGLIKDEKAFKRVDFIQGNAADLPFENNKFDFISTSLALEQMRDVQKLALKEISRVSAKYAGLLEPFPDFNQTPLRKIYTEAREYFSIPSTDLQIYGLEVKQVFTDFPSKLTRGVAYVLSTKVTS